MSLEPTHTPHKASVNHPIDKTPVFETSCICRSPRGHQDRTNSLPTLVAHIEVPKVLLLAAGSESLMRKGISGPLGMARSGIGLRDVRSK